MSSVGTLHQVLLQKAERVLKVRVEKPQKSNFGQPPDERDVDGRLQSIFCSISGTLTVEEVYKDRDQFASLVREVAAPDVGRMGIEILSFTIKDVYDNVTYLASLGESAEYVLSQRRLALDLGCVIPH